MSWTEEKINQTIIDIKKRASEDEAYRKLCLDNPNEAVKKISGIEMPDSVRVNIIENDPGVDHTIIIPHEVRALKSEELDHISGGRTGGTYGSG